LYLANGTDLFTVDPSNAAETLVAPLSFDPDFGQSGMPYGIFMSADPLTGTIYASILWPSQSGGDLSFLGTINTTTGYVTDIGATDVLGLEPLVVVPASEPASAAILLAGASLVIIVRRRVHGTSAS
jgi:hypothetical protein